MGFNWKVTLFLSECASSFQKVDINEKVKHQDIERREQWNRTRKLDQEVKELTSQIKEMGAHPCPSAALATDLPLAQHPQISLGQPVFPSGSGPL